MSIVAEFAKSHPIASAVICVLFLALFLGQGTMWFYRLFAKRKYYIWLLQRGFIRDICCDPYGEHMLLFLCFGNTLKGIKYLTKQRDPCVEEALIKALSSHSHYVREAVCEGLGAIGSPKAISPLIDQLGSRQTQNAASKALLELTQQAGQEVTKSLSDVLDGSERDTAVVSLLDRMREFDTLLSVLPRLKNELSIELAVRALAKSEKSEHPRIAKALMAVPYKENWRVVTAIATALKELHSLESVDYLAAVLKKPWPEARIAAAAALGSLADPRAVAALLDSLGDPNREVRAAVVAALAGHKEPATVEPLVRAMLYDRDNVRSYIRALAQIGDSRAVQPLTGLLLYCEHNATEIISALKDIGGSKAINSLIAALQFHATNESSAKAITAALLEISGAVGSEQLDRINRILNRPYDYEPLRYEDLQNLIRWVREGSDLEFEYVPPVYGEREILGPYGESWGTKTIVEKKGIVTLKEKSR